MGAKRCHAHATRHCDRNTDTCIHYFPDHHKNSDQNFDCYECADHYNYYDRNQGTNLDFNSNSDSHLRISHHTSNCYRYHNFLPYLNSYRYYPTLTMQTHLP